ncbi:MAG: hypothetical protein KIT84_02780 [Labilithrix sp.]|nr:hypothetical protein [Labilithrix sp.]MCW5809906.1 hypothetical protein [Labilithrix sp.]
MRPLSGLALGVAVTVVLAGCSLLVSFDEPAEQSQRVVPGDDDDDIPRNPSSSSSSSSGSSSSSSSSSSGDTPDAAPPPDCVADPAVLAAINCGAKQRVNCGRNFVAGDRPASVADTDLVDCTDGVPRCVKKCANGCVGMPSGYDDQCDPCADKANGVYCHRDFTGYPTDEQAGFQFAGECKDGKHVKVSPCGNGASGRCESACTRPDPVLPSCCR